MLKRKRKINKVRLVSTSRAYGLRHLNAPLVVAALLAAGIEPSLVTEMVVQGRASTHFTDCDNPGGALVFNQTPHAPLWYKAWAHHGGSV